MNCIREKLEKQLGELKDCEVEFAIEQFERNAAQVGSTSRVMTDAQALDELATNIDFYRRRLA